MRGQSPTDFESVSLTTRTSCLVDAAHYTPLKTRNGGEVISRLEGRIGEREAYATNGKCRRDGHTITFLFCDSSWTILLSPPMPTLLEMDYDARKRFVFDELKSVAQWSDVTSVDDFDMEQNKGEGWERCLRSRWTDERHLQAVEEVEPGRLPDSLPHLWSG